LCEIQKFRYFHLLVQRKIPGVDFSHCLFFTIPLQNARLAAASLPGRLRRLIRLRRIAKRAERSALSPLNSSRD
jgi:hypothetical protein